MKYINNCNGWATTVGLTVVASFCLAIHDASYRPAFVQVATVTLLTTSKSQIHSDEEANEIESERKSSEGKTSS